MLKKTASLQEVMTPLLRKKGMHKVALALFILAVFLSWHSLSLVSQVDGRFLVHSDMTGERQQFLYI